MYSLCLASPSRFVPFVSPVWILSEEKAFLSLLKCIQMNTGDNEGLAPLSQSCEPLAGKASSLDLVSEKRLFSPRLAFSLRSPGEACCRRPQTEGVADRGGCQPLRRDSGEKD